MPSRRCAGTALAALAAAALLIYEVAVHDVVHRLPCHAAPPAAPPTAPATAPPAGTEGGSVGAARAYAAQIFGRVHRSQSLRRGRRDVVLVVAWRRPEFLLMSLSHVLAATYADDHEYIFLFDHDVDPLVRAVAEAFPASHKRMHYTPQHEFMRGNSFNVLEGYRYAHMVARALRSELVYLLEEDVWVARDYFAFHRAAHAQQHRAIGAMPAEAAGKVFQVVGFSIQLNTGEFGEDHAAAVSRCAAETAEGELLRSTVLLRHHYTSVATSFDTDSLDVIARHATKRYYEAPSEYIAAEWGAEGIPGFKPEQFTEQDGLLNRDTKKNGWWTLSPRCPRAFHAGFTGYNRLTAGVDKGGSDGSLTFYERFEELAGMSPAEMVERASHACSGCKDVVPVPLSGYYASRLVYCAEVTSLGECADKNWPPAPSGQEAAAAVAAAAGAGAMGTDPCADSEGHRGHDIKAHDLGPSVRPAPLRFGIRERKRLTAACVCREREPLPNRAARAAWR